MEIQSRSIIGSEECRQTMDGSGGMMDQIRQCKDLLRALFREAWLEMERESRMFLDPLQQWVNDLVQRRLPNDWREQLASFLGAWEGEGFRLTPQSVRNLEAWIEAWAHFRGLMPGANDRINPDPTRQSRLVPDPSRATPYNYYVQPTTDAPDLPGTTTPIDASVTKSGATLVDILGSIATVVRPLLNSAATNGLLARVVDVDTHANDPIGFVDGSNNYIYVRKSPTNAKDPSGLATFWDWAMDYVALNLFVQWMQRVNPGNPLPNIPYSGYIQSIINNYGFTWIVKRTTLVSGLVDRRLETELASALAKPPGVYTVKGQRSFAWTETVPGAILHDSDLLYDGTATVTCTDGKKHADVQLNFEVRDQINALSFQQLYQRGYFNKDSTWGQWLLGYAEGLADLQEKLKLAEPFPVSFTFSDSKSK